jgi:hypothetical protein
MNRTPEEKPQTTSVEEEIDRCCPGFLSRIRIASGKEVVGVIYDSWDERGAVPPRGVIFTDYSHASRELVQRCIDEAVTEVDSDLPPAASQ